MVDVLMLTGRTTTIAGWMVDAHYCGWHWPTFNMADIGTVCGAGLLISVSRPVAPDTRCLPQGRVKFS